MHPYSYTGERLSKENKNMQPRSYIQQPYIDLSDINEVSLMQCRRINSNFFFFSGKQLIGSYEQDLLFKNQQRFGSRHRRYFITEGVLRNFAKFTGKDMCQSVFFNKVAGLSL